MAPEVIVARSAGRLRDKMDAVELENSADVAPQIASRTLRRTLAFAAMSTAALIFVRLARV